MTHYRWKTGRLVACGSRSSEGTDESEAVTCPKCRTVTERAAVLAQKCGCRLALVHATTAILLVQNEASRT